MKLYKLYYLLLQIDNKEEFKKALRKYRNRENNNIYKRKKTTY